MFFPGSRYEKTGVYTVTLPDGREVSAARLPLPASPPLAGFHRRQEGQRLDHLATMYVGDATAFWQLCDAANAMSPDAVAVRDLVPIPIPARGRTR